MNGLDTNRLGALAQSLQGNSAAGHVTFATPSRWQDGARVLTSVEGFRIDGPPVHADTRKFVLLSDEPTELSGTDAAPGPAEQLMHAVAACISATVNANAALMGVRLSGLHVRVEGDIDLHGILGLDPGVRPGLGELRARVTIAGDAEPETLREVAQRGIAFSPIRDSVEKGVNIKSELAVRRAS